MSGSSPIISVAGLTKHYTVADKDPGFVGTLRHFLHRKERVIEAVKGVSFDIQPGEIVGFLGPNGAGKTTTLKMLTGLIHHTSGALTVAGHPPFGRDPRFLKRITLVMGQKQQLIWDLPAADSLRVNAAVYGIERAEANRRMAELAELLDLSGKLSQPVRKLSLGERMKAELLAALLHRPEILFLDEPTLGLDINAQAAIRDFLRSYNERYGATVLLTSHYMADITALCPRVLMIHEGELMYDGELAGLINRFAPLREVKLVLEREVPAEALSPFGEVEGHDGRAVRLLVPRAGLTAVVSRMLAELPIVDLTITDPPIEEIIGRAFKSGGQL